MKKYITPGLILILAGLYFLVDALPGVDLPGSVFFLAVGLALLIARLTTGRYGLSIAGFVVFCLGAGWSAMELLKLPGMYGIVATLLSLALAFLLIHICEYRRIGHWPLLPALILLVFGVLFFLVLTPEINEILRPYYGLIFPVILIALGVWLLVRGALRGRRARPTASFQQVSQPASGPRPVSGPQPTPGPQPVSGSQPAPGPQPAPDAQPASDAQPVSEFSAAAAEPDASPLTPEQEAEFVLAQSDAAASAPAEDPAVTPEEPTERKDTL